MFELTRTQAKWVFAGLAALMALTRFHHFGTLASLPDASLAVFFFAGLYVASPLLAGVLVTEAVLIDYLAVGVGGVSDWCLSPAYVFLLPGYVAMWLAGRFCARFRHMNLRVAAAFAAALLAATTLAFVIANAGFYSFSGRFGDMPMLEYATRVARYLPRYLTSTLLYATALLLLQAALAHRHGLGHRQPGA